MALLAAKPDSALLILGHGSTENAQSSVAVRAHTESIRQRGLFAEVHCAFWKEEPSFKQALSAIGSREIYVVPAFISEGYFTRSLIPEELGLDGRSTRVDGRTLFYCAPVGSHPSMTDRLLDRAAQLTPGLDRDGIALIIVGHGTSRDSQSAEAIRRQVERIRASDAGYAEVSAAYLSEEPFIGQWDRLTRAAHVVVVPFFIADGLHSMEDIPRELGLPQGPLKSEPSSVRGRKLYYSGAIGTDPGIADVIVEQVVAFDSSPRGEPEAPL